MDIVTKPHTHSTTDVLASLGVEQDRGLTDLQVREYRTKYGPNEVCATAWLRIFSPQMPPEESTPFWKLVIKQFEDKMVRILLVAATISFVLACFEDRDRITAFTEPLVILLILIANATIGVIQETNAEKAIEALKLYEPEVATVIRNGQHQKINASELVVGDIVEIVVGAKVPADLRVIQLQSTTLRCDQALLTGESHSVQKHSDVVDDPEAIVQDKTNMLFRGTTVSNGKARAVVTGTGPNTAIGSIRKEIVSVETQLTPLELKLDEFGDLLTKVITVICILVWLINIGHFADAAHGGWLRGAVYYFKIAVALGVAAIPEGLPAVVTTCLALGTKKMAKKNAIVRSLPSVETLGCTSVICSDKTGTLTTNQMSICKALIVEKSATGRSPWQLKEFDIEGTTYAPEGAIKDTSTGADAKKSSSLLSLSHIGALCNDAEIVYNSQKKVFEVTGEPTEGAIRVLVEKIGGPATVAAISDDHAMASRGWEASTPKLVTLEFTRDRKSMSVLVQSKPQSRRKQTFSLLVKGAPESVLERCTHVQLDTKQDSVPLTPRLREQLSEILIEWSTGQETLRCLAFARIEDVPVSNGYDRINGYDVHDTDNFVKIEQGMTFVGLVGMRDPPRAEVREAIAKCRSAGIRVIVITGDNKATAEAICRRIGIFEPTEDTTGKSYTGREFSQLTAREKAEAVERASLFARVEPAHKSELVGLLQQAGHVAAMTGDGVNDAPALRLASMGIAMGTGTAVAKGAAEMILADDNFATIVTAVEEGRAIYNNTKQFIRYLISSNIGEVVSIFLTAALGMPEALVPVQLLWVNLVTDGLPATALGFNKPDKDIMKHPPRHSAEPLISGWLLARYLIIGVYVGIATVGGAAWWFMFSEDGPHVTWSELVNFHSCVEGQSYSCDVFSDTRPTTVALSILVTVEMFNALNALSENQSLLIAHPFQNMWLVGAVVLSFVLHFCILYIPFLATVFEISPLNWAEWKAVLYFSAPVLVIDELLKVVARLLEASKVRSMKKKA